MHEGVSLWLRVMDDGTALLLPVCARVEPAEEAFCATIEGLGDSLIGMGSSASAAVESAHLLLRGRVDHALEQGEPLQDVLEEMAFVILPGLPSQPPPAAFAPAAWAPAVMASASA